MKRVFVTGTAGFIGFHLAKLLLEEGFVVHGYDGMTDYYDVKLKYARHGILKKYKNFVATEGMLEDMDSLSEATNACQPDTIVHLAAQAGVRYSIENPRSYVVSNIVGTFNVMEAARIQNVNHLLMASTSSVYGANVEMPYSEEQATDTPMSFYAATKKANESMGHAWAHIHELPVTMFRFFTVYGPWGRPDMAPHKFTRAILAGEPIQVFNHGEMWRDFTFIDDIVLGIRGLIDAVPASLGARTTEYKGDSLSSVAPFRVVNIGNNKKVKLEDFISTIEFFTGHEAIRDYREMQQGDVPATWAKTSLLSSLTGFQPQTDLKKGVAEFVDWFKQYYSLE